MSTKENRELSSLLMILVNVFTIKVAILPPNGALTSENVSGHSGFLCKTPIRMKQNLEE